MAVPSALNVERLTRKRILLSQKDEVYPRSRMEEDLASLRGAGFAEDLAIEILERFARFGHGEYAESAATEIVRNLGEDALHVAVARWVMGYEDRQADWLGTHVGIVAQRLVEMGFKGLTSGWSLEMPEGDTFAEKARPPGSSLSTLPPSGIALGRLAVRAVLVRMIRSRPE